MLKEWADPPPMSAAAPLPAVLSSDSTLWVAYRIARDPQHCAVVRFHHVEHYAWGEPPSRLGAELSGDLPRGSFYEVPAQSGGTGAEGGRRWLVTFPEAILEVRAGDAEVVLRATAAVAPAHALAALLA
jgi:hypothetical protein